MFFKKKAEAPPQMPLDWNDSQGWDRYYASLYPHGRYREHRRTGSISEPHLPDFVTNLLEQNWRTVWIPGCGLSAMPRLLAQLGMDVYATDISPSVIAYQQSTDNDATSPNLEAGEGSVGTLTCALHDFRQAYLDDYFDLIINVKAIQGFPSETMKQVVHTHYRALKPGRQAYFDTMNVQGEKRDLLETTLVETGFFVPFYKLNQWYRQKLSETNIPYVFILGRPIIPMKGVYASNEKKRATDTTILQEIVGEYEQRAEQEQESEQQRLTETDRIANVIYSTG